MAAGWTDLPSRHLANDSLTTAFVFRRWYARVCQTESHEEQGYLANTPRLLLCSLGRRTSPRLLTMWLYENSCIEDGLHSVEGSWITPGDAIRSEMKKKTCPTVRQPDFTCHNHGWARLHLMVGPDSRVGRVWMAGGMKAIGFLAWAVSPSGERYA